MSHTYSSLYQLPTTGLRFSRVYDRGGPDMAHCLSLPEKFWRVSH